MGNVLATANACRRSALCFWSTNAMPESRSCFMNVLLFAPPHADHKLEQVNEFRLVHVHVQRVAHFLSYPSKGT